MMSFEPRAKRESASETRGHRFPLAGQFGDLRSLEAYSKSLSDIVLAYTSSWHRTCPSNRIMKLSAALLLSFAVLASPSVASAQGKSSRVNKENDRDIPANMRPPEGMCRVWLDDVPAAQQPAPTDCPTAVRNRPAKGRVIFGDDYVATKTRDTLTKTPSRSPAIKGFAPSRDRKPPLFP